MEKRPLGATGEDVSILGIGGFHLLEISHTLAGLILNRYLDAGGNYLETSAHYGAGASEAKIGRLAAHRRDEYLLATKARARDRKGAMELLEQSLKRLRTDHVDVWFMHSVNSEDEAAQILAPGGALEAAEQAKREGKVRFVALSNHGRPSGALAALGQYPFDALMLSINYYDHFNFPEIAARALPLARENGVGVMVMKAVADGYLWRSAGVALRWALGQPVSHVVVGVNSTEMLDQDLAFAANFRPLSAEETDNLYATAPEYRGYVCRQCPTCQACPASPANDTPPLKRLFELEGWYDRQMWDGVMVDPADYALRVRLGKWYGQQEMARAAYAREGLNIDPQRDAAKVTGPCRYGLDIPRKMKIAVGKLTGDWSLS